jgi:hypothetical protein
MNKFRKEVSRYLNFRNVLILTLFLIVSFFWFKYIAGLILIVIFAPLTFLSLRYSKMIPHVSAESNTGMSIFMGYAFGPAFGFLYSISVGGTCYVMNSFVTITYLTTMLLAAVSGAIAGVLHGMGFGFGTAFILSFLIRTAIAWPLFGVLGIDPIERFTHQVSQLLSNMIIYLPLLSLLYGWIGGFIG